MFIFIKDNERALLFKQGNYMKVLMPGKHFISTLTGYSAVNMDMLMPFRVKDMDLDLFLVDETLTGELSVIDIKDDELAIHYVDGRYEGILETGKYAFWNVLKEHTFKTINLEDPELDVALINLMPKMRDQHNGITSLSVENYEKALLFYDNTLEKTLEPGVYYYWNRLRKVTAQKVDMRQQQIDMTGQEIMSKDKVTLRLNFTCQYRIVDVAKVALEIKDYKSQLYILLQLNLREYVGSLKLDDLLKMKEDIAGYVLGKLKEYEQDYGIEFVQVGVKDIILPGEIKDILNTVLIAEKKAEANVITRREEVASTRSLLNTAKLLDENATLLRLKELEYMERVCERVGHISVSGGGNVLEQLREMFG